MPFNLDSFDVEKFDSILARGLSFGLGKEGQEVCIEAAICEVLGLGHSDDPKCVSAAVRSFKIALNDSSWSSTIARAKGLRDLGLAQLGSLGIVDDQIFAKKVSKKTIRILIPKIFRLVFPTNIDCLNAASKCENEGTPFAADAAADAARAVVYSTSAAWAAEAAEAAGAFMLARAGEAAARAAADAAWEAKVLGAAAGSAARAAARVAGDEYLNLSATIALDVLRELKSPGIKFLEK